MLRGDLATMPLADLLQWLDATRKSALVEIEREGGLRTWLATFDRKVVAAAPPVAHGILAADGTTQAPGPGLRAVAIESLLDLFFEEAHATFTMRDGAHPSDPGVAIEVPIGFVVMEGLRQLDEWPRIESTYSDDGARLRAIGTIADAAELSTVQRAIHHAANDAKTLGELRLVLGLSRHALLRRIDELASIGLVEVEGSVVSPDLPTTLVEQARVLLREGQFAESAHVLRTLLASSPGDPKLQRLLAEIEAHHVADCYQQLSPTDLVRLSDRPARPGTGKPGIASAEQAIVDALTQKPRSVAGLVLVSPLRELETLAGLLRLVKKGIVEVERGA